MEVRKAKNTRRTASPELLAYWAGSASASIEACYRAGIVNTNLPGAPVYTRADVQALRELEAPMSHDEIESLIADLNASIGGI